MNRIFMCGVATRSYRGGMFAVAVGMMSLFAATTATSTALADPCGMVPPIYIQGNVPLARTGLQKTYVFYKDGVETFVIRPGFTGKVEEFGMLIPFPSPPALRKVPDAIFGHIAAAIDPPEVVVDLRPRRRQTGFGFGGGAMGMAGGFGSQDEERLMLSRTEIRVINQEAVGMYEVAVLEAGSADALNRWMTDHGYRYPDGMDDVCADYIEDRWCFVAIKAKVGQKSGADPQPGMTEVDTKLPPDTSFDGHVQGMGFRFQSDELVVPMRLSAFNEGDLHNVVYLLTDKPMQAKSIDSRYVKRQISGDELYRNVTASLPLRIIGGEFADLTPAHLQRLKQQRDQAVHNGLARDLFAGDLSAAHTQQLSHPYEELEKQLLQIGERLELRGPDIDRLHANVISSERDQVSKDSLADLKQMTLTVIDGDFPRDVIAAENVTFTSFKMNSKRNSAKNYNAVRFGPAVTTFTGAGGGADESTEFVSVSADGSTIILQDPPSHVGEYLVIALLALAVLSVVISVVVSLREKEVSVSAMVMILAVGLCAGSGVGAGETDWPGVEASRQDAKRVTELLGQTTGRAAAEQAVGSIVAMGRKAVRPLERLIANRGLVQQGWAIVCLAEIDDPAADEVLRSVHKNGPRYGHLVQSWAIAARISRADSLEELRPFFESSGGGSGGPVAIADPELHRPFKQRLKVVLNDHDPNDSVLTLLELSAAQPQLQTLLSKTIVGLGPKCLANAMVKSPKQNVRNSAAAWLSTIAQTRQEETAREVIAVLKFDDRSEAAPWQGGPLWVPSLAWSQSQARELVSELTSWYVWAERTENSAVAQQIVNNFSSVGLQRQAGVVSGFSPQTHERWLEVWGEVVGQAEVQRIVDEQR